MQDVTDLPFWRLMAKYGHGPLAEAEVKGVERVLFSSEQIQQRVRELEQDGIDAEVLFGLKLQVP